MLYMTRKNKFIFISTYTIFSKFYNKQIRTNISPADTLIPSSFIQGGIQKFQDFIKNKKLVFFCKHFIGRRRNSPLRTEYNDLHDQEDYRMTLLGHPSVWRSVWRSSLLNSIDVSITFSFH